MAKTGEKKKLCFVVGPIGDDESDDRTHADLVLEEIIQPVFADNFPDFRVERADKISDPGRIDAQVITALLNADLVVADLSTLNPNAFYEIGIRHTIQKPIIHMHLEGQRIPFDIASFRSIKFSRKRPRDIRSARETLKEFVETTLADGHQVDNPVTFSRGKVVFEESATPRDRVLIDEIKTLGERLSFVEDLSFHRSRYAGDEFDRLYHHASLRERKGNIMLGFEPLKEMSKTQFNDIIYQHIAPRVPYISSGTRDDASAFFVIPVRALTDKFMNNIKELAQLYDLGLIFSDEEATIIDDELRPAKHRRSKS